MEPPESQTYQDNRPPSPAFIQDLADLEALNEQLRQMTESPELRICEAEDQRRVARMAYDELIELGGIPARPWVELRREDLRPEQRAEWDGEYHLINLYCAEEGFWRDQLKLWKRFMKRRTMDNRPDIRKVDRLEAVSDFVTYLRGHLQRDLDERAELEVSRKGPWVSPLDMSTHRDFIELVLDTLPAAEAALRELRGQAGGDTGPEASKVTRDGLKKEYKIPDPDSWDELWKRLHENVVWPVPDPEPSPGKLDPEPSSEKLGPEYYPGKRARGEDEEQVHEARPIKRIVRGSKSPGGTC
ncbi:hypothetical protein VTK26DRAFT_4820 [Humicola hyalothermophila]